MVSYNSNKRIDIVKTPYELKIENQKKQRDKRIVQRYKHKIDNGISLFKKKLINE